MSVRARRGAVADRAQEASQPDLWGASLPDVTPAGRRCARCQSADVEGRCDECGAWLCWPCGAGYGQEPLACHDGDDCRAGRAAQWDRHVHLMLGLLAQDCEYPRENLETFVRDHEKLWRFAKAASWWHSDSGRYHYTTSDARDFRIALRRARKRLGWPEPTTTTRLTPTTATARAPHAPLAAQRVPSQRVPRVTKRAAQPAARAARSLTTHHAERRR